MFSPYDINDYSILNPGAHFVGDVASAHIGEKYMYSGKISELIFYNVGRLLKITISHYVEILSVLALTIAQIFCGKT